jgi:hypothetical protein
MRLPALAATLQDQGPKAGRFNAGTRANGGDAKLHVSVMSASYISRGEKHGAPHDDHQRSVQSNTASM